MKMNLIIPLLCEKKKRKKPQVGWFGVAWLTHHCNKSWFHKFLLLFFDCQKDDRAAFLLSTHTHTHCKGKNNSISE